MRRAVLALLVSVLVLVGCDDGSPDAADSDAPGSTIDTNFASPGDERFCELARTYIEQFTRRAPPGDVREFGESLQNSQEIVLQMQEVAPAEIVSDVLILADVLDVVVPALEAAEFDLSQVPPSVLQQLQDPGFQASAARLQAYTESACEPVTGAL